MNRNIKIIITVILLNVSFLLCGCNGGGEIGKTYTTTQDEARTTLYTGWEQMKKNAPSSAKATFEAAISQTTDADQIAEANLGIGWAVTQNDGIRNAKEYFERAEAYLDDAKIGMAGYYLSTADPQNYAKAITILEKLNISNTATKYEPKYEIGINNADVHALLGVLYYYTGQMTKSREQLEISKTLANGTDDLDRLNVNQICDQLL